MTRAADLANGEVAAIASLVSPRSIAVVGASERSRWCSALLANLDAHGYRGDVHLVNPRAAVVAGRQAASSCAAIGEQVDTAVMVVPARAVLDAVGGLADAGVHSAVVLTSGFGEVGAEGQRLQRELERAAQTAGVRLLGPNSLGFMNFAARTVAWSAPVKSPSRRDGVALVSQSGATAYFLTGLAHQQEIGLSHVVATGNEADLDCAAVIQYFVGDPDTRAIAVFLESVRDPRRFVAAAQAARAADKPLVVLKVGASEATARSALAHTGALVGDDRVFDGICQRYGILRVHSMEELLTTADVIARTGPLRAGGLCVISNSGGVCEIAADTAEELGIDLPDVPGGLEPRLRAAIPDYATPHNPLDVTGGITPEGCGNVVAAFSACPAYSAVLMPFYPVPAAAEDADERLLAIYRHVSRAMREASVPGFLVSYTGGALTEAGRRIVDEIGMRYLACGLDTALTAFAAAFQWSRSRRPGNHVRASPRGAPIGARPRTERDLLELMRGHGIPVVPQAIATDEASALAAGRAANGPVALKIASGQIRHKTEIGGVALGVRGAEEVTAAFRRVLAAGEAQRGARVDGVLVSPMREGGTELFVGCSTDLVWGPVIAVGLGGIWVEVFSDVAVRPLPVAADEVKDMLSGLRGARLLAGERGTEAADIDAVAAVIAAIGDLAGRLGPGLAALDVNPLWVRGKQVEVLDALAVWQEGAEVSDD